LERAAGIEPASSAWKAEVLPLHNARAPLYCYFTTHGWSSGSSTQATKVVSTGIQMICYFPSDA